MLGSCLMLGEEEVSVGDVARLREDLSGLLFGLASWYSCFLVQLLPGETLLDLEDM